MADDGRRLRIRGLVQGVGFRPYVWRLATELGLRGWVRNDGAGVTLEVAGVRLGEFLTRLPHEAPRLARIDGIDDVPARVTGAEFIIRDSVNSEVSTAIGPDAALCAGCIDDLFDPAGRRWRYPFTTCTHCGPRYTVSRKLPYDRAQTSLAGFALCPICAAEYGDPGDRRFHAETTCCPICGPRLSLLDGEGRPMAGDPLADTVRLLREGRIVAIKGLGGFHLACDATNAVAVEELRFRKQREAKPFAVMGLNPQSLAPFAQIDTASAALLQSAAAPIVLCPKGGSVLEGVAPDLAGLGIMLPATPLHVLLWHEAAGRPAGRAWLAEPAELLLVMTSANPHGEPLVIDNAEALARLGGETGIADAFLVHDRDIVVRCDDSVVRATPDGPAFIRRARGFVPVPVALAESGPPGVALGAYLKNTICVARGSEAYLSQHIGGLDNAAAIGFLEETVAHLLAILEVRPAWVAHDLHPDYPSTHLAVRMAEAWGVPAFGVGHHHAHIAAICAEHGVNAPILGLALDGVGLGSDGGAWGGELLHVADGECVRLGHLQPLALPGGDRAAREPWRMALSALHGAGLGYRVGGWMKQYYPARDASPLLVMLERQLRCPTTTSLGRWFDAAAGLLGLRDVMQFEGQAAMQLEGLAAGHGPVAPLSGGYQLRDGVLDFSPLLLALLTCGKDVAQGAALFHATVAAGLADWVGAQAARYPERQVAVGGGCAMNAVLMEALRQHFDRAGWQLLEARQAPPNDGGLALGQAWVARHLYRRMGQD